MQLCVSVCKAGLPVIARMRVASALGFLSGLEPAQAERFYARLGEGFSEQGIEPAQAEPALAALPDDAARAAVSGPVMMKMIGEAKDFESVIRQVAAAGKWGAADAASVFARGDRGSLKNERQLSRLTVQSSVSACKAGLPVIARMRVSGPVIVKMLGEAKDFEAVIRQVAAAGKWGAADAASVFARGDRGSLTNVINLSIALKSDHAEANAYLLAASEALLKVDPDWDGSYYFRASAFVKTGKPAEAIPFYEKALGMTTDEHNKKAITTALEEARAAVRAYATPVPGPVPAPK